METSAPANEPIVIQQSSKDLNLLRVLFGATGMLIAALALLYPYSPRIPFLKTGVEIVGVILALLSLL
ncbi:MAG: hypothetical protein M1482_07645, partial [Chloroflexi bacterium]|nr:hypothetical protein [Chloroflexota bacterium]